MTTFTNRTDALAHAAVRNMSQQLAFRGALPPEAARQMCDGFVSHTNLAQAKQAMELAYANGDSHGFRMAQNLHFALGVAMQFQDRGATLREGLGDAMESQAAQSMRGQVDPFGNEMGGVGPFGETGYPGTPPFVPGGGEGPGFGTGLVVGGLFAGAIALMSGQSRRHHHRHDRLVGVPVPVRVPNDNGGVRRPIVDQPRVRDQGQRRVVDDRRVVVERPVQQQRVEPQRIRDERAVGVGPSGRRH